MSRFHAARAAARIKEDLNIDVELQHGKYGEYKVFVDGKEVYNGGFKVALGLFPSIQELERIVRSNIAA